MTWWIISKIAFYCGFFIAVHVVLTEKYLGNRIKPLLSSEPLLKINLRILRYLDSHTSLNIWDILAEYWSMIETFEISDHPVVGLIKFMNNNWSSFVIILLSVCLNLASILYVLMRSTHNVFHGIKVPTYLSRSNPYLALRYFKFMLVLTDSIEFTCLVNYNL